MLTTCRVCFPYFFREELDWPFHVPSGEALCQHGARGWAPQQEVFGRTSIRPVLPRARYLSPGTILIGSSHLAVCDFTTRAAVLSWSWCPKSFWFLGYSHGYLAKLPSTVLCSIPPTLILALGASPPRVVFTSRSPLWCTHAQHSLCVGNTSWASGTGGKAPLLKFYQWIYSEASNVIVKGYIWKGTVPSVFKLTVRLTIHML